MYEIRGCERRLVVDVPSPSSERTSGSQGQDRGSLPAGRYLDCLRFAQQPGLNMDLCLPDGHAPR